MTNIDDVEMQFSRSVFMESVRVENSMDLGFRKYKILMYRIYVNKRNFKRPKTPGAHTEENKIPSFFTHLNHVDHIIKPFKFLYSSR